MLLPGKNEDFRSRPPVLLIPGGEFWRETLVVCRLRGFFVNVSDILPDHARLSGCFVCRYNSNLVSQIRDNKLDFGSRAASNATLLLLLLGESCSLSGTPQMTLSTGPRISECDFSYARKFLSEFFPMSSKTKIPYGTSRLLRYNDEKRCSLIVGVSIQLNGLATSGNVAVLSIRTTLRVKDKISVISSFNGKRKPTFRHKV